MNRLHGAKQIKTCEIFSTFLKTTEIFVIKEKTKCKNLIFISPTPEKHRRKKQSLPWEGFLKCCLKKKKKKAKQKTQCFFERRKKSKGESKEKEIKWEKAKKGNKKKKSKKRSKKEKKQKKAKKKGYDISLFCIYQKHARR